jgi:predicted ATP-binding protein involved in virulence
MEKYIVRITGAIPHTEKKVDIPLNGKNLIITGANGAGKTSLLKAVFNKTVLFIAQKKLADLPKIKQSLISQQESLKRNSKGTTQYSYSSEKVESLSKEIYDIENGINVIIPENIDYSIKYDERKAIIQYYEDKRMSNITEAKMAQGLSIELEENKTATHNENLGNKLEQHLLNLKTRRSLAITEDKDQLLANNIDAWFVHFENNLKKLLEDDSAKLLFNSDKNKFSIKQNEKEAYYFQTLSAGYKAIFDIYADLLMRTEYFKINPDSLRGVVFIDEIDSHLHVSLQRLILPFFIESFPSIQFIVTTHSPFVLMSTHDTIVFDIGKNEPITEDLSYYTYSAVMKGLWNVKAISKEVENEILEIAQIVNSNTRNNPRLKELIGKIRGREDTLDNESKTFYLLGVEALEECRENV